VKKLPRNIGFPLMDTFRWGESNVETAVVDEGGGMSKQA